MLRHKLKILGKNRPRSLCVRQKTDSERSGSNQWQGARSVLVRRSQPRPN
jgi:hypothetical protein